MLLGTEAWANVSGRPTRQALPRTPWAPAGRLPGHVRDAGPDLWQQPTLELRLHGGEPQNCRASDRGLHPPARVDLGFQQPGENERWQVTVDAHTGEVLALEDENHYVERRSRAASTRSPTPGSAPPTDVRHHAGRTRPCRSRTRASPRRTTSPTAPASTTTPSGTVTTTLTGKYVAHRRHAAAPSATARPPAASTWAASTASTTAPRRRRLGRQHGRVALGLLRGQQAGRAGPRLAAHQHLAADAS